MAGPARLNHTHQIGYLFKDVTYSDAGISAGTLEMPNALPANAHILRTQIQKTTAFAATTTNSLTVGTVSGTANDIVTAGDLDETTTGVTNITGVGVISSTLDKTVYIKFAGAGTANTAGAATIIIEYICKQIG